MEHFSANISGLYLIGDLPTTLEDGHWIKNIIQFKCGKYKAKLTINPHLLKTPISKRNSKFKNKDIDTGILDIDNISSLEEGKGVSSDICWLLSFITQSKIVPYTAFYGDTSKSINASGCYNPGREILEYEAPKAILNFFENCWENYQAHKESRKLNIIFEYLWIANKINTHVEIQITAVAIALECLKSTFGHESEKYDYNNGLWYKKGTINPQDFKVILQLLDENTSFTSEEIIKYYNKNEKLKRNFNSLLTAMLKTQNLSYDLNDVIQLRNEIIHNGVVDEQSELHTQQYNIRLKAELIIREYILCLLGYKGWFFDCSNSYSKKYIVKGNTVNRIKET